MGEKKRTGEKGNIIMGRGDVGKDINGGGLNEIFISFYPGLWGVIRGITTFGSVCASVCASLLMCLVVIRISLGLFHFF